MKKYRKRMSMIFHHHRMWLSFIDEFTMLAKNAKGSYMEIIESTLKRWERMRTQFITQDSSNKYY